MTVDAYKHDDGLKSVTVEFDVKEREESIFATTLIDRFLDLPVMAFCGGVSIDSTKVNFQNMATAPAE